MIEKEQLKPEGEFQVEAKSKENQIWRVNNGRCGRRGTCITTCVLIGKGVEETAAYKKS